MTRIFNSLVVIVVTGFTPGIKRVGFQDGSDRGINPLATKRNDGKDLIVDES